MSKKNSETSSENIPPFEPKPEDPNRPMILKKVFAPAIALLITGVLNIILAILILFNAAVGHPTKVGEPPPILFFLAGLVILVVGIMIVSGARKMKNLSSREAAMTASILAMIPCLSCSIPGLPIGIWSLVVLMNNDVKQSFR
jgi:cytochrome c oxidase assembly factor CtaG